MTQRAVLVSGGSGGIGSAICRAFADRRVNVGVHYHSNAEMADQLVEELVTSGVKAIAVQADLTNDGESIRAVEQVAEALGSLDFLVNNAGWTRVVPADDLSLLDDALIDQVLRMKLHATLYCCRAAAPLLKSTGQGSIVNITSVAGIAAKGSNIVYAAANTALATLTRSLAMSLSPEIRVNAIAPGYVATGFGREIDESYSKAVADNNHIARVVTAEDIAALVVFLCLDGASITGEEIAVDGGIGRLGARRR